MITLRILKTFKLINNRINKTDKTKNRNEIIDILLKTGRCFEHRNIVKKNERKRIKKKALLDKTIEK